MKLIVYVGYVNSTARVVLEDVGTMREGPVLVVLVASQCGDLDLDSRA